MVGNAQPPFCWQRPTSRERPGLRCRYARLMPPGLPRAGHSRLRRALRGRPGQQAVPSWEPWAVGKGHECPVSCTGWTHRCVPLHGQTGRPWRSLCPHPPPPLLNSRTTCSPRRGPSRPRAGSSGHEPSRVPAPLASLRPRPLSQLPRHRVPPAARWLGGDFKGTRPLQVREASAGTRPLFCLTAAQG